MKTILDIINNTVGMEQLQKGVYLKVHVDGYMPLTIEYIGVGPHGHPAISVEHYGEQNGDAMRDPEICFEYCNVINARKSGSGIEKGLEPYYYRNDYLGVEQEVYSGQNKEGMPTHCKPNLKKEMKSFSSIWDSNLKKQGFSAKTARVEVLD